MPYSETCDTFRAADCTAAGTGSGSVSFVGLDVAGSVPSGFVFEHAAERGPASVEYGFCHPRLGQFRRAHIADDDQFVFTSNPRGLLVKVVTPRVGDLGVDRLDASLVPGPLRNSKLGLVSAVVFERRNAGAVRADGQRLESEVDADVARAGREIVGNLTLKADIPTTSRVLRKAATLEGASDLARLPEVELALEIGAVRAVDFHSTRNKRHPAERSLRAAAGTPAQMPAIGVPLGGVLAADRLHGIGVETEFAAARAQLDQVEGARPLGGASGLPAGLGLALDLVAVVPDLIACEGVPGEVLPDRGIFDAEFECKDHGGVSKFRDCSRQVVSGTGEGNIR